MIDKGHGWNWKQKRFLLIGSKQFQINLLLGQTILMLLQPFQICEVCSQSHLKDKTYSPGATWGTSTSSMMVKRN